MPSLDDHDKPIKFLMIGHGMWVIQNGFFRVPDNSWVIFYHQINRLMAFSELKQVIFHNYSKGSSLEKIDSINDEDTLIPDMSLYPFEENESALVQQSEEANKASGGNFIFYQVQQETRLSTIAQQIRSYIDSNYGIDTTFEIHWAACRATNLKGVGGKHLGVNCELNAELQKPDGSYRAYDYLTGSLESVQLKDPFTGAPLSIDASKLQPQIRPRIPKPKPRHLPRAPQPVPRKSLQTCKAIEAVSLMAPVPIAPPPPKLPNK